jgi:hypothetical protein
MFIISYGVKWLECEADHPTLTSTFLPAHPVYDFRAWCFLLRATFTFVFTRYNNSNITSLFHLHFIVGAVLPVLSSGSSASLEVTTRCSSLLICISLDPCSSIDEEKYKVYSHSQPCTTHVRISQSVRLCALI